MRNKMENLFIPYELAVIAKEKGFEEMCITCYGNTSKKLYLNSWKNMKNTLEEEDLTAAPLYQQILEWLFKEYNIFIEIKRIKVMVDPEDNFHVYWCEIGDFSSQHYKTPIQALKKGIEEAFKLI